MKDLLSLAALCLVVTLGRLWFAGLMRGGTQQTATPAPTSAPTLAPVPALPALPMLTTLPALPPRAAEWAPPPDLHPDTLIEIYESCFTQEETARLVALRARWQPWPVALRHIRRGSHRGEQWHGDGTTGGVA